MDEMNPALELILDWIRSSGNTALSIEMMVSYLEQMHRDDVVDVIQKGQGIIIKGLDLFYFLCMMLYLLIYIFKLQLHHCCVDTLAVRWDSCTPAKGLILLNKDSEPFTNKNPSRIRKVVAIQTNIKRYIHSCNPLWMHGKIWKCVTTSGIDKRLFAFWWQTAVQCY